MARFRTSTFLNHITPLWGSSLLRMMTWLTLVALTATTGAAAPLTSTQPPLEVGANTTIYFSDTLNLLVWEDKGGHATLAQAREHLADFKPAESFTTIHPQSEYWVVQKLVNRLGENREFIVDASRTERGLNWLRYQHYVVYPDGSSKELNGPFSDNVPLVIGDIDPHVFTLDTTLSRSPVFTLHKDSEVQLFSRLKSNSTYPATHFAMRFYDRTTYLELRKFGLYLEGILAGLLLSMAIGTWYNLIFKRDTVSIIYGLWLVAGFLQIMVMPIHDGQRMTDFFLSTSQESIGILPAHIFWFEWFSYFQTLLFIAFGRAYLSIRQHFPRFQQLTNVWIVFEAVRLVVGTFFEHQLSAEWFWYPSYLLVSAVCAGNIICSYQRYRQGMRSAQFSIIACSFYFLFYVLQMLNRLGTPIFDHVPVSALGLFIQDQFVLQAFGICLPALITHLYIQARSRGIEKKLRVTLQAQKEAAESQNRILESTVQERTRELDEQRHVFEELSLQLAKYVPPQIHEALFAGRYDTRVSTHRKKLTVLFSDIKEFTTTAESLQPEALTEYLNEYFSEMTQIALDHGATIDKYMGDAMMVFFGDPETRGVADDARACVEMALQMQEQMKVLGQRWKARGFDNPFVIRIGINTGYCNVGNFGSEQRLSYTIIGGEVNIAQRLESQCEPGGILMSYETYVHVQNLVDVEERQAIRLKGIARDIKAFAVKGRMSDSASQLSLHDPAGVSIDLNVRNLDAQSKTDLAAQLRALANRLSGT